MMACPEVAGFGFRKGFISFGNHEGPPGAERGGQSELSSIMNEPHLIEENLI